MSRQNNNPKMIVIAGPNGSGKTTITDEILAHEWAKGCSYINPDNIAKEKYGDWNKETALLAAKEADQLRYDCLRHKHSLIFETVLSSSLHDKVKYLRQAVNNGFFLRVFFVGTDSPQINIARVAQRVREGGHDVLEEKIKKRYDASIQKCVELATFAHKLYVIDNSMNFKSPKLLFRATSGKLEKQYVANINLWAIPIFDALEKPLLTDTIDSL